MFRKGIRNVLFFCSGGVQPWAPVIRPAAIAWGCDVLLNGSKIITVNISPERRKDSGKLMVNHNRSGITDPSLWARLFAATGSSSRFGTSFGPNYEDHYGFFLEAKMSSISRSLAWADSKSGLIFSASRKAALASRSFPCC